MLWDVSKERIDWLSDSKRRRLVSFREYCLGTRCKLFFLRTHLRWKSSSYKVSHLIARSPVNRSILVFFSLVYRLSKLTSNFKDPIGVCCCCCGEWFDLKPLTMHIKWNIKDNFFSLSCLLSLYHSMRQLISLPTSKNSVNEIGKSTKQLPWKSSLLLPFTARKCHIPLSISLLICSLKNSWRLFINQELEKEFHP